MFSQVPCISLFSLFLQGFYRNSLYGNTFKKREKRENQGKEGNKKMTA